VIFFDARDGLEVSESSKGSRLYQRDFGDPKIQSDVLNLYRQLHAGPKLSLTKTIFDMIEEHVEQGRELGSDFPTICRGSSSLRPGQSRVHGVRPRRRALLNDPMPGNFSSAWTPALHKAMRLID